MPQTNNFTPFGIATISICVPSYLLIFSLNSDTWQERYKAIYWLIRQVLAYPFNRHRSESERSRKWWSRFREPESEPVLQRPRQSYSLTAYEDLVSRTKKSHVAVGQKQAHRPPFPQANRVSSRDSAVKFDLPSF